MADTTYSKFRDSFVYSALRNKSPEWWIRTGEGHSSPSVLRWGSIGSIDMSPGNTFGIRPAIWIKTAGKRTISKDELIKKLRAYEG